MLSFARSSAGTSGADGATPALVGDWELLAFEGPQRQRKKLVRSKRKLILARDRRGEQTSVEDDAGDHSDGESTHVSSTAADVSEVRKSATVRVDEDAEVISDQTSALTLSHAGPGMFSIEMGVSCL
jgi:hypothetical protein